MADEPLLTEDDDAEILEARIDAPGVRLDKALAAAFPTLSRARLQTLLAEGAVRRDGQPITSGSAKAQAGLYAVIMPPVVAATPQPEAIPLTVLFEDADLIVIDKAPGMAAHPAPGCETGTLVNALLAYCGDSLSGIGGEKRPGIVHRIDRDTSGLIIAAKNDAAHLALSAQLKDHSLSRTYECLVTGNMKQDSGTVDAPIGRSSADRKKMAVVPTGRRAVTHWEVVARYPGVTHLRCRLETGRTHQIRVHMAYIGHPILGDTVYGAKKPVPGLTGQCLHATGLRFIHPRTGEPVELHCPLPPEFTAMLQKLQNKSQ